MDKWTDSCRSCLTTAASFSYSIYNDISPQTYLFCTSIEVNFDELPKHLCDICFQLLKKFEEFKKTCLQSENTLVGFSQSLKLTNETCSSLKIEIKDPKAEEEDSVTSEANFCEDIHVPGEKTRITSHKIGASRHQVVENQPTNTNKKTSISVLKLHESTKSTVKKRLHEHNFKCGQCNRKFAFKERLEGHMLEHQGKIPSIQCQKCNKTFRLWASLRSHIESCHSRLPFQAVTCPVCSKVCKTPSTLKVHLKTHEERQGSVCDECGKMFKSDVTFKNHLETHLKNRKHCTCEHCGKNYISKKTRAKHIYRRHTDKQFVCNYCNYTFTDKENIIRHIMAHEGRHAKYKCEICLKSLTSHASLVVHKRIHSGERPFTCSHCPKGFKDKGRLVEHERTHTGEKPFQCPVCEFRCSRRGSLRRHMKVHKK